jgi:preprotein translocase subunit SecY
LTTADLADRRPDPILRVLVTLGAVLVLFIGSHIPFPGLSADLLQRIRFGPSLGRLSIFALGVTPIIFGRAIVEIVRLFIPALGRWASQPDNDALLVRLGRILALVLAAFQGRGVAIALENMSGFADEPGLWFRIGIIATAVGATALLIWLTDIVTRRGFGDGLLIMLAAYLVARAPYTIAVWIELTRTGAVPTELPVIAAIFSIAAIVLLVAASRIRGPGLQGGSSRSLDVWPPILAMTVLGLLTALSAYLFGAAGLGSAATQTILRMVALAALIGLFASLRARALDAQDRPPNLLRATLVVIVVCVGAIPFSFAYQISSEDGGFAIVLIVAAALSCFSRSVRL